MPKKLTKRKPKSQKELPRVDEMETRKAWLENLIRHPGWIYLAEMMAQEVEAIEHVIITKKDLETGAVLTDSLVDLMRIRREIFTEVIGKPEQMIASLTVKPANITPQYDPYHTDVKRVGMSREDIDEMSPHTLEL